MILEFTAAAAADAPLQCERRIATARSSNHHLSPACILNDSHATLLVAATESQ